MSAEISEIKEKILNRSLALFSKYGFKAITMDDLSRELGMSKKTIYVHIRDRRELVAMVLEYEVLIQRKSMERMIREDLNAIDELIHVNKHLNKSESIHCRAFYDDLKKYYPDIFQNWLDYKRQRMYDVIFRNLRKGIKEELYRDDLNIEILSKLHMAQTEMMHASGLVSETAPNSAEFINEVFNYHIHGICNEKGLAYYNERKSL